MNPKTVLVTGPAGFIGSNFVKQFKTKYPPTEIVGMDNFSTGRRDALDKSITFYEGSVTNLNLVNTIFKKHRPEYVFHFAAVPRVSYSVEHPAETTDHNITGTVVLLEKSRDHQVKRFIYSSSSSVYGGAKILPTKETENPPHPVSPYGLQKYVGESFCQIFSNLRGLDTVCLRYFNVFGPGQYGDSAYSTVVSAWLTALYFPKEKKAFLEGNGQQSRDFCYVENVVEANILAMKAGSPLRGEALNIAHGQRTTLLEVKKLIEKFSGKKLDLEKRLSRLGDIRHTHADVGLAKKKIGYTPKINFVEGLWKTIAWFEKRGK